MPEVSIIIPIYNEEGNIPELYRRLTPVLETMCSEGNAQDSYEIIMVDDGSKDRSWQLIKEFHEKDRRMKGLRFSRNFGHHAAVLAGIDHCKGAHAVLMDGDLQDRPEEIPKLVEKMKEGYDIVQGIGQKRHSGFIRNFSSKLFHRLFVEAATIDPRTRLGLFRCVKRSVIESIKKLPERAVFLGGIVSWVGFNTAYVTVERGERFASRSKYNFFRRLTLAMNAVTSFSERPLIFIFQIGMSVFIISILMIAYTIFKKIVYGVAITGWASLYAAIFFSTGLITLCLSVVGLYISKLFIEAKHRPRYILKEIAE